MLRASGEVRGLFARVDQDRPNATAPHPRGAKAVIDQRTAARLSAVVGDGEFPEHAAVAKGGRAPEKPHPAAAQGRIAPVTAGVAALACLWAGARANHDFGNTVAHAAAAGGSFGAPTAAAGPMFGASRNPGEAGGDPAMTPKNSARVAAMAVAAAVTANGALAGDAVQWRLEDGGNGHWYRMVSPGTIGWHEARTTALALGGDLATVTSLGESDFILLVTSDTSGWVESVSPYGTRYLCGPWLGGYQDHSAPDYSEPAGGWKWVTQEPWQFSRWISPEPNNGWGGGEDFLNLLTQPPFIGVSPYWNDSPANSVQNTVKSFVVEWSADCNNDGIVDYGQILARTLADANSNGVPDTCECAINPSLSFCCPGDIYRNGRVDGADLGALLSEWGPVTPLTNSDLDGNGQVNGADLGILLAHWGPCGG